MVIDTLAATQLVVDAWAVLAGSAALAVSVVGIGLGIIYYLSGRIDDQSNRIDNQSNRIDRLTEEVALVRERVARLEGGAGRPAPAPLQPA